MEQRVENIPTAVQSITEKINLALMGDSLSNEARAKVEAEWQAGIENAIEDVNLDWYGRFVQKFFDKLRSSCL